MEKILHRLEEDLHLNSEVCVFIIHYHDPIVIQEHTFL